MAGYEPAACENNEHSDVEACEGYGLTQQFPALTGLAWRVGRLEHGTL